MDSAKTVYLLIALLLWLPIVALCAKKAISYARLNKKPPVKTIAIFIAVSVLLAVVIITHYNFTIWYQAPLVAERAGRVFDQRLAGEIDLPTYLETMKNQGLAKDDMVTVSGEELEQAGFRQQPYDLSMSIRSYEVKEGKEDDIIIYFMHSTETDKLYSYIRMKLHNNRWNVIEHKLISEEEISEIKPKVMFEPIKP